MASNKPSLWQVCKSVAASLFGVQSDKNRREDFAKASAVPFIVVGFVFVVLFVLMLALIANWVTA